MSSSTQPADTKPREQRRWLRFSLRTLLLLTLLAALPLAWLGREVQRYRDERTAIEKFVALGGSIDSYGPIGPAWLRNMLGERFADFFNSPRGVSLSGATLSDEEGAWLSQFRHLIGLSMEGCTLSDRAVAAIGVHRELTGLVLRRSTFNNETLHESLMSLEKLELVEFSNTSFDDAGFECFGHMPNLKNIYLRGSRVRGPGLVHLRGLQQLENVCLTWAPAGDEGLANLVTCPKLRLFEAGTRVTDAGMADIGNLSQLEGLRLDGCQVGDAGMKHLARLSKLWSVGLSGIRTTDEGLKYLGEIKTLKDIRLNSTRITSAGLAHLCSLPNLDWLQLAGTDIDDNAVPYLVACPRLRIVSIGNTRFTDAGIQKLKAAKSPRTINTTDQGTMPTFP